MGSIKRGSRDPSRYLPSPALLVSFGRQKLEAPGTWRLKVLAAPLTNLYNLEFDLEFPRAARQQDSLLKKTARHTIFGEITAKLPSFSLTLIGLHATHPDALLSSLATAHGPHGQSARSALRVGGPTLPRQSRLSFDTGSSGPWQGDWPSRIALPAGSQTCEPSV